MFGPMETRLLLVDGDESTRVVLTQRLRRSDELRLVGAAGDLGEASVILATSRPDVVLMNLHRGEGEGEEIDFCRALCRLSAAPVVALASFMTPERWSKVQQAGVAAYVLKLVDSDRLARELVRLADEHADGGSSSGQVGRGRG